MRLNHQICLLNIWNCLNIYEDAFAQKDASLYEVASPKVNHQYEAASPMVNYPFEADTPNGVFWTSEAALFRIAKIIDAYIV